MVFILVHGDTFKIKKEMNKVKISQVAAIGKNRELGKDNKLLWDIPEDRKHFREMTTGHVVIMGRKTYESIGRLLPRRINIIVTRDKSYKVEGAIVTHSIEEAIQVGKEKETRGELCVIGGAQIYEQAMKYTDKLYLTLVDGSFDADAFYPEYSNFKKEVFRKKSKDGGYTFTFLDLER